MTATTQPRESAAAAADARRRERRPDPRTKLLVRVIAAGAAALSLLSSAAPTGLTVVDHVWCAVGAAALSLIASRATRNTWLWMTGVAAVASFGSTTATATAVAALALAAASTFFTTRPRVVGAIVGGLSAVALLTLPEIGAFGIPSIIVLVAVAPVVRAGYQRSPRRARRLMRRVAGWSIVVVLVAGLAVGIAAGIAARSLVSGVDKATAGLDQVRGGDQITGAALFAESERSFSRAEGLLEGPWTWPARAVPVLSQHTRAIGTAAGTGRELASSAEVAASVAPYRELKARDGEVDLDQLIEFQQPVADATAALQGADEEIDAIRSPWLVEPAVAALDQLQDEVDDALPEAVVATKALQVAPGLLGGEGDRRYLVLFTSPAETRNLGGFTGSYGVLEAVDGKVDITVSGGISELSRAADYRQRSVTGMDEFLTRYGRYQPARYFQNLTASPDMETTADVAAQMFVQTTGDPIDGVIVADPIALQSLLALTGPVQVEGIEEPLTKANAAQFLLVDQYILYEGERDERKDRLEAAGRATFDALTERELPTPRVVGRVLGPIVDQKHLMFFPFQEDEQDLLEELGALGRFDMPEEGSDYLSVRMANQRPNKIDTFLHRDVSYDVTYDPRTGQVDATVTVKIRNDAPSSGLPDYIIGPASGRYPLGTARLYTSVYSPLLVDGEATINGQPVGVEAQTELGSHVYTTTVQVDPGGESTLVLHLTGPVEGMGDTYRLLASSQPLANPDTLDVTVRGPEGGPTPDSSEELHVREGTAQGEGEWVEDETYSVHMAG